MNTEYYGDRDRHLQSLFEAYREACPDPELSANFMPSLWRKIESRQGMLPIFGRIARGFATATLALASILAVCVAVEKPRNQAFYDGTYVEALAASHAMENALFYEPVHIDPISDTQIQDIE